MGETSKQALTALSERLDKHEKMIQELYKQTGIRRRQNPDAVLDDVSRALNNVSQISREQRKFLITAARAGVLAAEQNYECYCCGLNPGDGACPCCELRNILGVRQPPESRLSPDED